MNTADQVLNAVITTALELDEASMTRLAVLMRDVKPHHWGSESARATAEQVMDFLDARRVFGYATLRSVLPAHEGYLNRLPQAGEIENIRTGLTVLSQQGQRADVQTALREALGKLEGKDPLPATEAASWAAQRLSEVTAGGSHYQHVSEIKSVITHYEELADRPGGIIRLHPAINSRLRWGGLPITDSDGETLLVVARSGHGKAQPYHSSVITPKGLTRMGNLKVGDVISGADGKSQCVEQVFERGDLPVYRVTFEDGAAVECCDDHLWLCQTDLDRRMGRPFRVRSLRDIRQLLDDSKLQARPNHIRIPLTAPVEFDIHHHPLPLNPYLLGLYLGDGHACTDFSNTEEDILAKFAACLSASDEFVFAEKVTWRVRRRMRAMNARGNPLPSDFCAALRSLGLADALSHQKFIPPQYLTGSVETRLGVLQGLLDTDGTVVTNGGSVVEYSTTSPALRDHVKFIVQSLGGVARLNTRVSTYTHKGEKRTGRENYRLFIRMPNGLPIVTSKKHLARYKADNRSRPERRVASIELVGTMPCRCIQVSNSDHLYLTDGFVVTHNTALAIDAALRIASQGHRVDYDVIADASAYQIRERMVHHIASLPLKADRPLSALLSAKGKRPAETIRDRLAWAERLLNRLPIEINDAPDLDQHELRVRLAAKRARGVAFSIIENLDHMSWTGPERLERRMQLGELTKICRQFDRSGGHHTMLLAQANRNAEDREDGVPLGADTADSDQPIRHVTIMIGLSNPNVDSPHTHDALHARFGKNRQGTTGKFTLPADLINPEARTPGQDMTDESASELLH